MLQRIIVPTATQASGEDKVRLAPPPVKEVVAPLRVAHEEHPCKGRCAEKEPFTKVLAQQNSEF